MNHYLKSRTNGINCYGKADYLQKMQQMFPIEADDDQDILQALNKYFDPKDEQHIRFLQHACFKTPLDDVAKVYRQFRQQKHPNIDQPRISNYFDNNKFPALQTIQKWIFKQGQYPSIANSDHMKQQIAEVLLGISQQFGYIPNLQRFLLYYPGYLIKVLKFKNRFFQQRVQQTSQVTYLSPKNCCFAGIIAAIQAGCPYMLARMVNMFLVRDGNPAWITERKYPEQFKPLFGLFRKMAVQPWAMNQTDLIFTNSSWNKQVYFDYILAGMYTMSMSTICLALGLIPDQPCRLVPLDQVLQLKSKYDKQRYQQIDLQTKLKIAQEVKQQVLQNREYKKQDIQLMQSKQVEPYMKQIGNKINTYNLYLQFNKYFNFLVPTHSPINLKAKNNGFFYRYRDIIQKGLQQQRRSDQLQDNKFECFKNYCRQGSSMTFNNNLIKKYSQSEKQKYQNNRIFNKLVSILTYNLCGYHNETFDYKKYIKLNTDLSIALRFYVKLLVICPLYINKQVLSGVTYYYDYQKQKERQFQNEKNEQKVQEKIIKAQEEGKIQQNILKIDRQKQQQQILKKSQPDISKYSWNQCFDIGLLAIIVSENKSKLLTTVIQAQLDS